MSHLPVLSLAALVAVLGAAASGVSAYSPVVVPSSSSVSRDSRTAGNNKRIGTALKARTGTYGDIGDNLYDGLSVRAQSSTFRPLFNDKAATPIDTFSPQQQQLQQQRRYTGNNNTNRRSSSNALAGLFGRKNNNVNNANRYNSANNNINNGRRLSNNSGGRTNSIYDLYSRNNNNNNYNSYNSNGRLASTFNPQVARNSGVRLSDVGKEQERSRLGASQGLLQKERDRQQRAIYQRQLREQKRRTQEERRRQKQAERQQKAFYQKQVREQKRLEREQKRRVQGQQRMLNNGNRSYNQRNGGGGNYAYGNNAFQSKNSIWQNLGRLPSQNNARFGSGYNSNNGSILSSTSNRNNRVRLSDIGKESGRSYDQRNNGGGYYKYGSNAFQSQNSNKNSFWKNLGRLPSNNQAGVNVNSYSNGSGYRSGSLVSSANDRMARNWNNNVRLSDIGKDDYAGGSNNFRFYNEPPVSYPYTRGLRSANPTDYYYDTYNYSEEKDTWGGRFKGPTEYSLKNLVPYTVGKRFGAPNRNNYGVYNDQDYVYGGERVRKPTVIEKVKLVADKAKLKTEIMMLEKKIASCKKKYGVSAYEIKEELQYEYDKFVANLRRRGDLSERQTEGRIADYMAEMERDEEFRVQRLYETAESDVAELSARIRRKEEEIRRLDAAESGDRFVDYIDYDNDRYTDGFRQYARGLQKGARRKLRYDHRSSDRGSSYPHLSGLPRSRYQDERRDLDRDGRDRYMDRIADNGLGRRYGGEPQYEPDYAPNPEQRLLPPPRPSVNELGRTSSVPAALSSGEKRSSNRYGNSVSEW
eukprot:CAMPEP_0178701408 /NCGR_PEP_ID=MMETSP0699-20121125/12255_1 /TAXON_ID=265572 /ORGANISM="Extubocellulus spinifer, Strain CCMP396" /LENGTH=808 /DNA_ID=CAMNT_0020347935 /DNA_START=23 /DNA_END=2446 /DNA_ORIENTATION=-